MGCNFMKRSSDYRVSTEQYAPADPRPADFTLGRVTTIRDYVVAMVKYPHCTNFEGNKIIVWKGVALKDVREMSVIDPHFIEGKNIVARFIPTDEGWQMAVSMCWSMTRE